MRPSARVWRRLAVVAAIALLPAAASAAEGDPPRVLIIYPETNELPAIVQVGEGLRGAIRAGASPEPRIYEEYLDARRFPRVTQDAELARWWAYKYRNDRPDVIVSVTSVPLRVLHGPDGPLWPGVPIVFNAIDVDELARLTLPPDTTGVSHRWQIREAAEMIRRILPEVRRIISPYGMSESLDLSYREIVRAGMRGVEGIAYEEWNDLTLDQMRERLRHAPGDAAIFALAVDGDKATPSRTPQEAVRLLAEASSRPIFAGFRNQLGTGIVGGFMFDPYLAGQRAAEIVQRILAGERAAAIPVAVIDTVEPVFDARQLDRYGIRRSALPAGSVVLFDEPSVFQRYRWQILTALAVIASQMVLIAVLLGQRRRRVRAQHRLDDELRFEQLVSEVATTLSTTTRAERSVVVVRLLERIATAFDADCAGIAEWRHDESGPTQSHVWQHAAHTTCAFDLPAVADAGRRGVPIRWDATDRVPAEAASASLASLGPHRALLLVPIVAVADRSASLGVSRISTGRWTDEEVERLRTIGQPLAAWVQRQWAESEAISTSALNEALVTALASQAAIVDTGGVVWWFGGAPSMRLPDWLPRRSGVNILALLDACPETIGDARRLREAIAAVLEGAQAATTVECRHGEPPDERWFEMRVRALDRPERGAAVAFHDITQRKQFEFEHQVHLQEMAHLDRVASLGALATSLAHELNQPLTAILANAQAAQVLLEKGLASPAELRDTLEDIAEDDRRAGDIIHRMRRLLKKGDVEVDTVDLNVLSRDAVRLVSGRAARQRVSIEPALARAPVLVSGDSVQLQQVIVNLLLNAIDASAERADGRRTVVIETATREGTQRLAVYDSGRGVDATQVPRIFRPFFSTKTDGLGMGLSISRTIVEAHRGQIWAENGEHGAIFHLSFPSTAQT